jgi:membrane associated rhomboid family serine protease/tetratricopeptide (TPR) repeat protein
MVRAGIMIPSEPGPAPPHGAPFAEPSPARRGGTLIGEYLSQITPRAWVTPTLAALIVVAFVFELARGASPMNPTIEQLFTVGASFGPAVADGQWWRTLSAMFLHAGLLHIALNLWAFLSVGKFVERIFGNAAFLAIYLLGGFAGELASLAVHPMAVGVGASGAIFSVYGALLAFGLVHKGVFPKEVLRKQRSSLLAFVGYNVVFGVAAKGVDIAAHAGGFLGGMAAGALLNRDLLHPAAHRVRRTLGGIGLAAALLLGAFGVQQRLLALPAIRAQGIATRVFALLERNEAGEAERECVKWLARNDVQSAGDARGLLVCAEVARQRGDAIAERARLDACLAVASEVAVRKEALLLRARLHERAGRLADSVNDDRALVAIAPDMGDAWNNLAWGEVVGGDFAAARADADRAVSLEPDSGYARGTRCFALAGLEELQLARSDCARAVELTNTAIDRGMLAFLEERYADARREWEDASRDPVEARALEPWLARLARLPSSKR